MPTFTIIDGIKIECYSGDYLPPHVHATYSGEEALIIIDTLEIYEGSLPSGKLKIARDTINKNKEALLRLFDELNTHLRRNEDKQ